MTKRLNSQQRDILAAKVSRALTFVSDDYLIAVAVLLGYSLDQIDKMAEDFA